MAEDAARPPRPEAIDFIFSCSICQATLSAVYATHDDDGLRRSADNSDGSIIRLWLTECAHITCAKHLDGGGLPFHPQDQPPKAPCPLCVRNNQDHSDKILYAIRGTAKGDYDDNIPVQYFQVPPLQLGNSGNEALRFQYVSLIRFASRMYERLYVSERELHTWKARESAIVASLAAMEPLSRLQQRLASRDIMPPPSGRLLKRPQLNASRSWASSRSPISDHPSMEPVKGYGRPSCHAKSADEEHIVSNVSNPSLSRSIAGPKPRLASVTKNISPNLSRFVYDQKDINSNFSRSSHDQKDDDGELDKTLFPASHRSHSSTLFMNRLTLPPSTPSVVSYNTPRRSVGMSANIRTSQPPFLTPKSTSSLQARLSHRNSMQNNQPMASPHFSNRTLVPFNTAQRPYTNGSVFSTAAQGSLSIPRRAMPMLGSTSPAPPKFSWLNAPLPDQMRCQSQQRSNNRDELQDVLGAHRLPGGPRQPMDQPLSLNSFSFTSHPQIGGDTVERRSENTFISHGRRAARR
ncbi:MAG: hypothetical protein Q9182_003735 [Xanthomendoza sp. 2 TL-2023]